jgi:hypothetical protein
MIRILKIGYLGKNLIKYLTNQRNLTRLTLVILNLLIFEQFLLMESLFRKEFNFEEVNCDFSEREGTLILKPKRIYTTTQTYVAGVKENNNV